MKSKSFVFAAIVFVCGLAGGLVYANMDALGTALAAANEHSHGLQASAASVSDPLGCHRHAPATYHCH